MIERRREILWALGAILSLITLASLTLVGSTMLRFQWFAGLFRMPHESVLIPVWLAGFSAIPVLGSIALLWTLLAFYPATAESTFRFLLSHVGCAVVAAACFVAVLDLSTGWERRSGAPPCSV